MKIFTVENKTTPEKQQIVNDFFFNGPGMMHLEYEAENPDKIEKEEDFDYDKEFYAQLLNKVEKAHNNDHDEKSLS